MRIRSAELKDANEGLKELDRQKSMFLASMNHELRTPLNAILGFSSLMRNDAGISKEQRKALDIINRSGEQLLSLVNNVLDTSKLEAGQVSIESVPFDLWMMVRDVYDLLEIRAVDKRLYLRLEQSSEFPRFVRADSAKLRQALINLVGNAVKFTDKGGVTLRLKARAADNASDRLLLLLEVEDTGCGITAADQARIFEPYVQAGKMNAQKGTGLGLAITRAYVELMGGRISVESTPESSVVLRPEALATLPQALLKELTYALVSLDVARIGEIIRRVSELDPALGDTLGHYAGRFGYTTILHALQAVNGSSTEETT